MNYVFFYVYLRRYSGLKIKYSITFTVKVYYTYFRNLEGENIKEVSVTCPLNTENKNVFQLNCSMPVVNEKINTIVGKKNTFYFDDE